MAIVRIEYGDGSFLVDREEYKKHRDKFNEMYIALSKEVVPDERVQDIYFGYDEKCGGNTIQVLTTRCSCFRVPLAFEDDYSNYQEVLEKVISKWLELPKLGDEKEQYEGKFNGKNIKFSRVFGSYRFSDEECEELLAGKEIQFEMVTSNGEEKTFMGNLQKQEYQGFLFYGFKTLGISLGNEIHKHKLTPVEKKMLIDGEQVYIKGMYSEKKNKFYDAWVSWNMKDGIKMDFKRPKPYNVDDENWNIPDDLGDQI